MLDLRIVCFAFGFIGIVAACGNGGGGSIFVEYEATCNFYKNRNRVTCSAGGESASCTTRSPYITDPTQTGGPTPNGEYLIGERITHSYHLIDWYRLHPKTNSGKFWHSDYWNPDTGRSGMGLHRGTVSEGCVTVVNSCWSKIRNVLDKATVKRKRVYTGTYTSFTTPTIGTMFVRD